MSDSEQLGLSTPSHYNQHLFSDHYLDEVLPRNSHWRTLEEKARSVMKEVAGIFQEFIPSDNERQTEDGLVLPILELLGHTFELQPSLKTSEGANKPDYVFYQDEQGVKSHKKKTLTDNLPNEGGIAIGDAKYWNRPLDIAIKQKSADSLSNKNPSYQISFYMRNSGVTWGILTNGKRWRLYHRDTSHKLDHFYEVDIEELVLSGKPEHFLYFYAFFRREAFDEGPLSIAEILKESIDYASSIGNSLKDQVYDALRHIAQGFLEYPANGLHPDPDTLKAVHDNSLILLYRLIFLLYAEARGLLPIRENPQYREIYSLDALKKFIAREADYGRRYLPNSEKFWVHLKGLFEYINEGSSPLEIATYNGGLFDPEKHEFLTRYTVGDRHLLQAIDKLSRVNRKFVDYRDLAIQHMGTIYEGLLEYRLQALEKPEDGWDIELVNDKGERKVTGSYFTPDPIVKYIVEHSLGPVLKRAVKGKEDDAGKLQAVLQTNVLDPAMGSGHFLVEATEYVARFLVDLALTPDQRNREEADLAFWKRRVAQSCIYGVDLNPLAVELAKLSLWLTTVAKDRPLSFLDHHLRPGNSLVGARLQHLNLVDASKRNRRSKDKREFDSAQANGQGALLTDSDFTQRVSKAVGFMNFIEDSDAIDVVQVKAQGQAYLELRKQLGDEYGKRLNLVTADQVGMEIEPKHRELLPGYLAIRSGYPVQELESIMDQANEMAEREHFFHWELEFPEIYFDQFGRPLGENGGFDAVIGNPPWERIKLQENEFFAGRDKTIALAPKASDRKRLIEQLSGEKPELWQEYEAARKRAESFLSYAHNSGFYPLMGKGDTNYYALFAERALQLVTSAGQVGLLVPSGIATDDTTKGYFQHLVNRRMLAELLDFENREKMFPDVDSRFKFSVFLVSGEGSPQDSIRCGFFLHNMRQAYDEDRISLLRPEDFRLFNPNTLTCPIFRRRRDAELTRKIYEHAPVLIDKSGKETVNPWGISFLRMFDMTNDSGLFRTAAQLEGEGYWLGEGNVYTKGEEKYLPLYEGKMVQMYDHRAATIVVNAENVHRPAQEQPTSEDQHKDPAYSPSPQFWVPGQQVTASLGDNTPQWLLGFKSITAPTNVRSFICAPIPICGVGNSMPILKLADTGIPHPLTSCLVANLSAFVLDFAARQKIGGQNLNFFIVEQFPVLPPETYKKEWQGILLGDFIKERVLELCYTANDLKGFADDMGYDGPPFKWDEERRLHLRCQLDALYFHLYGLTRDEAGEILDTFPIVKRQDEAKFGAYRTKDLILTYYNAYEAGNMDAWVKG